MAYAAVTFLLDNLNELSSKNHSSEEDHVKELDNLKLELTTIKSSLESIFKTGLRYEAFKSRDEQIKDAIYPLEDTVDFLVSRSVLEKRKSVLGKIPLLRHLSVGALKEEIGTLKEEMLGKLHLKSTGPSEKPTKKSWKQDLANPTEKLKHEFEELAKEGQHATEGELVMDYTPYKDPIQDVVVGLEDEINTLIAYLEEEEAEQLEVISITGISGIGKTTMARRIYRDVRIQREFPTRIWVTVSEDDIKYVYLTIMKVLTKQDMSKMNVDDLRKLIPEYLETGKFLIILDDVGTTKTWEQIREVLPKHNRKGKVLITTRNNIVADSAKHLKEPLKLRHLNVDESWDLMRLQVFERINGDYEEWKPIAERLAKYSEGFPLSIMLIGGILLAILSQKESADIVEVKKILEKVDMGIRSGIPRDKVQDQIEHLIRWSYITLPRNLRDCFLYLGVLPSGTPIPVTKVILLWISEGFVMQEENKSLEETGRKYLRELVYRNLLIVDKQKIGGKLKACRVHDMIHVFCKKEAGKGKWKLFQEIRNPTPEIFEPPIMDIINHRRLCIHNNVNAFVKAKPDVAKARSFLCFSKSPIKLDPKDIAYLGDTFNMVRVLEATTIELPTFPVKITQLVHLRYITLSCVEFKVLPESFSNLFNLHTLVVRTLSHTVVVKADIWKLMHLSTFKIKASILLKEGESDSKGGENLKKLTKLSSESFTDDVITRVKTLKELGLFGKISKTMFFDKLKHLDKLMLYHEAFPGKQNPDSSPVLAGLPPADKFSPKLKFLVLSGTYLNWKDMTIIEKLPDLQVLKLKNNAFKGDIWDIDGNGSFSSLETLTIAHADLKFWTAPKNSFPKLTTLELEHCEKLEEIPQELGNTLVDLSMYRVPVYAITCAQKMQKENVGLHVRVYPTRY